MNPTTETGYIYVIHAPGTNCIKIGYTDHPRRRMAELQVSSPVKLRLLLTCPGTLDMEGQIHGKLSGYHKSGEWFELPAFSSMVVLKVIQSVTGIDCLQPDNTAKARRHPHIKRTQYRMSRSELQKLWAKCPEVWRIERDGRRRYKMTLRYINDRRIRFSLDDLSPGQAAALSEQRGKGRNSDSRINAITYRQKALDIAAYLRLRLDE